MQISRDRMLDEVQSECCALVASDEFKHDAEDVKTTPNVDVE
jgi:hypothetical protein